MGIVRPLLTPLLPDLLRPNMLRPKVEPFYQLENGLSRWKCSTYGLTPPRYGIIMPSTLEAVQVMLCQPPKEKMCLEGVFKLKQSKREWRQAG